MRIIDPHVHVWANDPAFPWPAENANPPAEDRTAEDLLALMDANGVEKTVLVQVIHYRWDNSYIAHVVKKYPDREYAIGLNCFMNIDDDNRIAWEGVKSHLTDFHGPPIPDDLVDPAAEALRAAERRLAALEAQARELDEREEDLEDELEDDLEDRLEEAEEPEDHGRPHRQAGPLVHGAGARLVVHGEPAEPIPGLPDLDGALRGGQRWRVGLLLGGGLRAQLGDQGGLGPQCLLDEHVVPYVLPGRQGGELAGEEPCLAEHDDAVFNAIAKPTSFFPRVNLITNASDLGKKKYN